MFDEKCTFFHDFCDLNRWNTCLLLYHLLESPKLWNKTHFSSNTVALDRHFGHLDNFDEPEATLKKVLSGLWNKQIHQKSAWNTNVPEYQSQNKGRNPIYKPIAITRSCYFISVPNDHTVPSQMHYCNLCHPSMKALFLSLRFVNQQCPSPCPALGANHPPFRAH